MYQLCCVFEYHVLYKSAICASLHLKHSQTVIGCTRSQKHLPLLSYETVTPHYTLNELLWRLPAASHKCNLDTQCNRRKGQRIIAASGVEDEMCFVLGFFLFFPWCLRRKWQLVQWVLLFLVPFLLVTWHQISATLLLQCTFVYTTPSMHPSWFCFSCVCTVHTRCKVVK